jgi:hypothetical protein
MCDNGTTTTTTIAIMATTTTEAAATTTTTTPRGKLVKIQRHHPVILSLDGLVKDQQKELHSSVQVWYGYQEWLRTFWLPGMQKKHPNLTFSFQLQRRPRKAKDNQVATCCLLLEMSSTSSDMTPWETTSQVEWEKSLRKELKKLVVEDWGNLKAHDLWNSIPEQDDHEGRGRTDLARIEQELNVKVVFGCGLVMDDCSDDNDNDNASFRSSSSYQEHVLLVGPKVKLTKKCFVLRHMLAHYYWRLTGHEVKL